MDLPAAIAFATAELAPGRARFAAGPARQRARGHHRHPSAARALLRTAAVVAAVLVGTGCTPAPAAGAGAGAPTGPIRLGGRAPGPHQVRPIDHSTPVPPVSDPRERIAFWRGGSIWLMHGDGTAPISLTARPVDSPDDLPALSPRGDAVAYASIDSRSGLYRLMVLTLADRREHPITDGGGIGDGQAAWSPDGRRLAFLRGDPRDQLDLYVVQVPPLAPAAGSPQPPAPRLLLRGDDDDPERVGHPVFSRDGASIVLSADRRSGHGTGLYRLELSTGALRRLSPVAPAASGAPALDLDPSFSPDGSRIAFVSNRHRPRGAPAGGFDIYTMSPDGSGLRQLTDRPDSAREPAYSPDGQRLFFAAQVGRSTDREWDIYVMAAGGGHTQRLTRDERPHNRAPSPALAK